MIFILFLLFSQHYGLTHSMQEHVNGDQPLDVNALILDSTQDILAPILGQNQNMSWNYSDE